MPKVICGNSLCKYNNDKGVCTAKKIGLSHHYVTTVWEGKQEYLSCKAYEKSDMIAEIENRFKELFQKEGINNA